MSDYVPTSDITDDDKLWALLSYIFTPLIPIIMVLLEDKKARPFIKYHAIQALVFGAVYVILSTVLSFVFIGCIIGLAGLGYSIYLGVKAYGGEYVEIPVVTEFCKGQGWI